MSLPAIRDFAREGYDPGRYQRLAGDWWLAVADVVGSTKLAAAGRDRDVNFIAGAVVAALGEVARRDGEAAAVQFGGDGAIAAVPPDCVEATRKALAALAFWSRHDFDIGLRIGMVPVSALEDQGLETLVALHDFGNGNSFGIFLGAGAPAADSWVKTDARWRLEPAEGDLPGIEGLSCRWRPFPNRRGLVLCVIADATESGAAGLAALARLQHRIEAVVPTADASPLGDGDHLAPRAIPTAHCLGLELHTERPWRRPLRLVRALIGGAILATTHALGGRLGAVDVIKYRRAMAERSDYRKLAGGPRLVLDVSEADAARIEAVLAEAEAKGEIVFGTARSEATTMTCLVGDFMADRHVHFVDGEGLGFWRASVVLKAKLAEKAGKAETPRPAG